MTLRGELRTATDSREARDARALPDIRLSWGHRLHLRIGRGNDEKSRTAGIQASPGRTEGRNGKTWPSRRRSLTSPSTTADLGRSRCRAARRREAPMIGCRRQETSNTACRRMRYKDLDSARVPTRRVPAATCGHPDEFDSSSQSYKCSFVAVLPTNGWRKRKRQPAPARDVSGDKSSLAPPGASPIL